MAAGGFEKQIKKGKEALEPLAPGVQTEEHLMKQARYLRFWSALTLGLISVACLVRSGHPPEHHKLHHHQCCFSWLLIDYGHWYLLSQAGTSASW